MKKQVLFFVLFMCSCHLELFAQAGVYSFLGSQGTYSEITGSLCDATGDDDISSPVPIGFNFNYCGKYYTRVIISTNGWISPDTIIGSSNSYNNLSSTYYFPFIAPLWDNLSCTDIRYSLSGSAPDRIFTVQWKNAKWNYNGTAGQNFQVKIFETSNQIKFIYGAMIPPASGSASIGINCSTGGNGNFISITPGSPHTISSVTANDNISSATYLANGLAYNFSPPVCNVYPLPFSEGFETGEQPTCWKDTVLINMGGYYTPDWSRSSFNYYCYPMDGDYLEMFNSGSTSSGSEARLSTPALDFSGVSNPELKFFMYHHTSTYYEQEGVQIQGSTNGTTWINIGPFIRNGSVSSGWEEHVANLSQFGGQPVVYVALKGHSQNGYNTFIDRVRISQQNNIGVPGTPGGISSRCQGSDTSVFTTTGAANAASFLWIINPPDAGAISGNGTTATVVWDASFTGIATIFVKGVNGSDESQASGPISVSTLSTHFSTYSYISPSNTNVCPNTNISFSVYNTGTINSYLWNFGDGSTSSQEYPSHSYAGAGDYTASVHITNGCADTTLTTIIQIRNDIHITGNIYLNINPKIICPNTSVSFNASASGVTNYLWNFGDGIVSTNSYSSHTYSALGTYIVSLKLINNCGMDTTVFDTVYVENNVHFSGNINTSISPKTVCPNSTVSFFSNTSGATSYLWNFGDGITSNSGMTYHSYSSAGTYYVSLKLINNCGIDTMVYDTVYVKNDLHFSGQVTPSISPDPHIVCPNTYLSFYYGYPDFASLQWDFGDGATSTDMSESHAYSSPGTYNISLHLTNNCGNDTTVYDVVEVNDSLHFPSQTVIYSDPNPSCPNSNILFYTNPSAKYYLWSFGDGTTSAQSYVYHSYSDTGNYQVSVKLTNGCGIDTTVFTSINIVGNLHYSGQVYYSILPNPVCPDANVYFSVSQNQGTLSYLWTFGDGDTSANNHVSHSYQTAGNYAVSIRLTNGCGIDTTIHDTVRVKPNLHFVAPVYLTFNKTVCPNEPVSFSVSNDPYTSFSQSVASWLWAFGDGSVSTSQYPSHTYTSTGTYIVSLKLTNACGLDTTITDSIMIKPNLHFSGNIPLYISPQVVCPNNEVFFYVERSAASYLWDFGNGLASTQRYTSQDTYTNTGTYQVSLTLTNGCGFDTTVYGQVEVKNNLHVTNAQIYFSPDTVMCPGSTIWFDAAPSGYTYLWDFGVGSNSTEQAPSHQFPGSGNYNVSVKITNGCNFDTTVYQAIHIQNNAAANPNDYDFSRLNDTVCLNDTAIFYFEYPNEGTYLINFGDGTTSTVSTPFYLNNQYYLDFFKHKYTSTGNYTATVTFTTFCGEVITKSTGLIVGNHTLINIDMDYFSENTCKNQPIEFLGLGGSHYVWNFGDGSSSVTQNAGVSTVTHTFTNAGTFTVSLTASNSCGTSDTRTFQIYIDNCSTTLNVNAGSDKFINCGSSVNLNAMVYYPDTGNVAYSWSPSAGLSATNIANPVADPVTNSIYTVTVTAPGGETATDQVKVTVTPIAVTTNPDVTINCTSSTTLNASTTATGATFNWSPSTGLSATNIANPVAGPLHTTVYTVTVTAGSCTATGDVLVSVSSPDYGTNFYASQTVFNEPPFAVQFVNSTPALLAYNFTWHFGDETSQSSNNGFINHTYQYNGTYTVTLIAAGNNGCDDSLVRTGYIYCTGGMDGPPNAGFTASPTTVNAGETVSFTDNSTNSPTGWKWIFPGGTPGSSTLQNPSGIVYNNSGIYNVTLIATNNTGSDTLTKINYITVNTDGIDDNNQAEKPVIIPNPNKGIFYLKYSDAGRAIIDIKIVNYLGQVIFSRSGIHVSEKYNELIDLNTAAPGIYFMLLETKDKRVTGKIVIE